MPVDFIEHAGNRGGPAELQPGGIRHTNGGATWEVLDSPYGESIKCVDAWNWTVVGGGISRTTDGG